MGDEVLNRLGTARLSLRSNDRLSEENRPPHRRKERHLRRRQKQGSLFSWRQHFWRLEL